VLGSDQIPIKVIRRPGQQNRAGASTGRDNREVERAGPAPNCQRAAALLDCGVAQRRSRRNRSSLAKEPIARRWKSSNFAQARGRNVPQEAAGEKIVDYHFMLADRADMRWPLLTNFCKLISRTVYKGEPQYTLPILVSGASQLIPIEAGRRGRCAPPDVTTHGALFPVLLGGRHRFRQETCQGKLPAGPGRRGG
jgi:hypothetical protein